MLGGHPLHYLALNPERLEKRMEQIKLDIDDDETPSAWLVSPYFFLYFTVFIINSVVWPLQLMERICRTSLTENELSTLENAKSGNSCIATFITVKPSNETLVSLVYDKTIEMMVIIAVVGGVISLVSYILLWKLLLEKSRGLSLFLPPLAILGQSLLMDYSRSVENFDEYQYFLLPALLLPSLHGGWQGMFLWIFHLSEPPKVDTKKTLFNTKLDGSHGTVFCGVFFAGLLLSGHSDGTFNLLSFFQFTLVAVHILYAIALVPHDGSLLGGNEKPVKDDADKSTENDVIDTYDDSSSAEDEFLLANAMQHRQESVNSGGGGKWRIFNPLKEAPLIFTETSYQVELIIVLEICVFTFALLGDTGVGVFYAMDVWRELDTQSIGLLVAAQGVSKIIGLVIVKLVIYRVQVKHGFCITLALLSYVLYYTMLTFANTRALLAASMLVNVFGALAFPAIFSFIKINLRETAEVVVYCSMLLSLMVGTFFSGIKLLVYEKTRSVFPGACFALTASLLLICGLTLGVTYFTSAIKNQRKSKDYADKLLSSKH